MSDSQREILRLARELYDIGYKVGKAEREATPEITEAAIEIVCREWARHGDCCFDWDDPNDGPLGTMSEEGRTSWREDARQHLEKVCIALADKGGG